MENQVLLLQNVSKSINRKEIIKDISFSIKEGEVLGFLGPNGAGKSTTLRMIVGLSKPTRGTIEICGNSISKSYVKAMTKVGCIIEGPDMYNYLTGLENLKLLATMNKNVTNKDILAAVELVGMQHRLKDKVATYSLGMKQRLGLAQALIHKPSLLVLDEPTNGLDPAGINEFRHIIITLAKEQNLAVLISSHLISEVELMCDKVAIIKDGSILKYSGVSKLLASQEVFWVLDDNETGLKILKNLWSIQGTIINGRIEASIDMSKLTEINASLIANSLNINFVDSKHKTLENLFLNITEGTNIIN